MAMKNPVATVCGNADCPNNENGKVVLCCSACGQCGYCTTHWFCDSTRSGIDGHAVTDEPSK